MKLNSEKENTNFLVNNVGTSVKAPAALNRELRLRRQVLARLCHTKSEYDQVKIFSRILCNLFYLPGRWTVIALKVKIVTNYLGM